MYFIYENYTGTNKKEIKTTSTALFDLQAKMETNVKIKNNGGLRRI